MMADTRSRSGEWKAHWPLVVAAMVGYSFDSLISFSIGLFMEPLGQEFGWSRAQISSGLIFGALFSILFSAPIGIVIDKWGVRRLAIPGLFLTGSCMAAFSLAGGSIVEWLAMWTVFSLCALAIKSTVWATAVSGMFGAGRGLALGVTMSGSAVAQVVTPPLAQWLIAGFGWRTAYVCLGLGWGGLALVLALFFLFDARDRDRQVMRKAAPAPGGLTLRQAIRTPALLRIGAASFITMFLGVAIVVHQVPILTDIGVSRENAAYLASLTGVAGVVGKLVTGWMIDRWNAGWVGSLNLSVSAVAFAMLLMPFPTPTLIVIAMMIIGYSTGSKLQISAYLTSRYGGMRHFGAIFGLISSLVAFGSGLGPLIAGAVYDHFGSYAPLLVGGIPGSLLCGLLIFRLGAYPDWSGARADAPVVAPGLAAAAR